MILSRLENSTLGPSDDQPCPNGPLLELKAWDATNWAQMAAWPQLARWVGRSFPNANQPVTIVSTRIRLTR